MQPRQQTTFLQQALEGPTPKTLSEALRRYELVYMPSRNFSAKTRLNYHNDLADLIRFLEQHGKPRLDQVSRTHLEYYLADLDARGYAGTSRKRKTYAIKSFFAFLYDAGYIPQDITQRLVPPKVEHKEPRVLSKQEYLDLLRACAHHPRDAALVEALLQTGIRLSEAARLRLDDVELPAKIGRDPDATGRIHIMGKGRKDRWIPLNYKACQALQTWLKVRPSVPGDALFVTKFQQPMGVRAIEHAVDKYLKEAGIKGASVHTLRHTFATHHVAQGTSLRSVQEILGHADLKTTSIYVQLAQDAVRKELQEHAL
jgi:site-specific recombinase XerD